MTIEAETLILGKNVRRHELKPGTTLNSVEQERWIPRDPLWRSPLLYLTCTVVDSDTIEIRSSYSRKRNPEYMSHETTLACDQINGKLIRGRLTRTRLSWKPQQKTSCN